MYSDEPSELDQAFQAWLKADERLKAARREADETPSLATLMEYMRQLEARLEAADDLMDAEWTRLVERIEALEPPRPSDPKTGRGTPKQRLRLLRGGESSVAPAPESGH